MKQHILVTGGAGYIGSHAVRALLAQGYDVTVVDFLKGGHKEFIPPEAHFFETDLGDSQMLRDIFQQNKDRDMPIQAVIHFAGRIEAGLSGKEREDFLYNNVVCGERLLRVCEEFGMNTFIFSSTAAVYGEPEEVPIKETADLRPVNYYGTTKLEFERRLVVEAEKEDRNFKYVALRYFNAAGADPQGGIGEWHPRETHLIPRVLQVAKGELPRVEIYGVDYPTKDGTCVRDYIHVNDLVDAHLLALEYLFDGGKSDVFNLGNGEGFTVREIITAAEEVVGGKLPVVEETRREGDPVTLVADSSKAREVLGWQPKHAGLHEILETAWNWERQK
ncbi:MAG: UDP-glucose 4-epimerase GalE [Candidatus Gracilibacteria bacterium]